VRPAPTANFIWSTSASSRQAEVAGFASAAALPLIFDHGVEILFDRFNVSAGGGDG